MADFVKTITNSVKFFGNGVVSRWGSMVWGTDPWGAVLDIPLSITKVYSNTLDMTPTIAKDMTHYLSNQLNMSSTVGKETTRYFTNTIDTSNSMTTVNLKNSDYYYVFPGDTTNFLEREQTSFTLDTISSSAWSETSFTTTTWS